MVAGVSNSNDGDVTGNNGSGDYWVVKIDSIGNIQWEKSLGGTGADEAKSVRHTSDGGYVVSGYSNSNDGDVSGNHGSWDYWVVKLDSSGNLQWQKALGGTGSDFAYYAQQTTDGGFIVTGHSSSNDGDISGNHGGDDFWLVKLDGNGNLQWQKALGGTGNEISNYVQQTLDGGYITAGWSNSNDGDVSGGNGSSDFWVVKVDGNGDIQWQNCFGGTNIEMALSVIQTTDGGYAVIGLSGSNNGDVSGNHGMWDY